MHGSSKPHDDAACQETHRSDSVEGQMVEGWLSSGAAGSEGIVVPGGSDQPDFFINDESEKGGAIKELHDDDGICSWQCSCG